MSNGLCEEPLETALIDYVLHGSANGTAQPHMFGPDCELNLAHVFECGARQWPFPPSSPTVPFGIKYAALDVALARQTYVLVERLQHLGLLRGEVDARAIRELVFNNTNMMFIVFVKSDNGGVIELRKKIMAQLRSVVTALSQ